jgi:hypothetical protein
MSGITFMSNLTWFIIYLLTILIMFLYFSLQAKKEKISVVINSKVRKHSEDIYSLTDVTYYFKDGNFSKKQKELITSHLDFINSKTESLLKEIEDYSKEPEKI